MATLFLLAAAANAIGPPAITASALPAAPYVEVRGGSKHLNFDLLLHNIGMVPLRLVAVREQIYGVRGDLRQQREVNANGKPSALSGLGELILQPGAYKDLFQPFQDYDAADGAKVRLTLIFLRLERPVPAVALDGDVVVAVEVKPRAYRPAAYCLPLDGRLLVHDGHDLNSHHRRRDLVAATDGDPVQARNANLYAYDFVRIDDRGALFHGSPDRKENWLTFDAWITAPVGGVVDEAVDGIPDNDFVDGAAAIPKAAETLDPRGLGNHVLIRAADGRVSWLLHMEPGTVTVETGQHVVAGERLGRVGFSGDSLFPHLHYTVTDSPAYPSQGVPSYFAGFRRMAEGKGVVSYGQIDTGDIIETKSDRGAFATHQTVTQHCARPAIK